MSKVKSSAMIVVLLLLAAALYAGWTHYARRDTPITLYGNVDIRTVNLAFRVGGRLATLHVDEGDSVKAGQAIAELDTAPHNNALRQADANVASAAAQSALLQEGYRREEVAQVRSQVDQAQAAYDYADSFYQRQQGMWRKGAVAQNTLEDARSARQQALATLQAAKEKLSQFESGNRPQEIAAAQAALVQAQAAQAQASLDLSDTTLTSPSDGVILTRAVEAGSMLSAGSTVFTLSLTRPVWIRAYIDEPQLGQAKPGREVLIYTDSRPDHPYHGTVGFVSPSAEFTPKSVETQALRTDLVYRLRIIVNDPDDLLRQGMPVTLRFATDNVTP